MVIKHIVRYPTENRINILCKLKIQYSHSIILSLSRCFEPCLLSRYKFINNVDSKCSKMKDIINYAEV